MTHIVVIVLALLGTSLAHHIVLSSDTYDTSDYQVLNDPIAQDFAHWDAKCKGERGFHFAPTKLKDFQENDEDKIGEA